MSLRLNRHLPVSTGSIAIPTSKVKLSLSKHKPFTTATLSMGEANPPHGFKRTLSALNLYIGILLIEPKGAEELKGQTYTAEILLRDRPVWIKQLEPHKDFSTTGLNKNYGGSNALTNEFFNVPAVYPRETLSIRFSGTAELASLGELYFFVNQRMEEIEEKTFENKPWGQSTVNYTQVPM